MCKSAEALPAHKSPEPLDTCVPLLTTFLPSSFSLPISEPILGTLIVLQLWNLGLVNIGSADECACAASDSLQTRHLKEPKHAAKDPRNVRVHFLSMLRLY